MSLENTHDIGNVKIVMLAGGGGGGAVALSDLTDVNILNPSNGQVLGYNSTSGKWQNMAGGGSGTSYAGLGIGKKTSVSNNVIDTDIDLHRAPMVGDRLLIWFDVTVQNPTGLTTYNNGTAVTSGLENVTPMYINAGWNILKYENSFLGTGWVRVQNVPIPNNTLSGLSDTAIVSPSDGQMLAYDNSSSKWKNKTIAPNNSGTPVRELKTLQIGDNVFDTFGLKTFDVTSVTSGVSGAIAVDVITASQLNGEIIAVHTGSNTGTTTNAWTLALNDGQTIEALTMSKGGSAYTDAITANCLLFVKCDISNSTATLLGIAGAGTTVQANPTGTPTVELNKLKIGNGIYDTTAIRPHTISSISSGSMTVHVTNLDQLNGKVIAICTESNTGTTSLAWELNLSDGGSSAGISMTNADGTDFVDAIVANELLFVYVDADNFVATVLGIAGASGGRGTAGHLDGTTVPTSAIGNNGDEYFKLSGNMPNMHITSFKFKVTATRNTGSGMCQYSQLSFFDASDNTYTYPSGTTWTDDVGHVENDPITAGSKILLNETPSTVTVNLPSGSYIDITVYNKFGWYTANDSEDRDPVSWELYVSEDGVNYILVDTRTQETITTNRQELAFKDSYVSSTMPVIDDIYYKKSGEWLKAETAISALSDTAITTPTDGQVLTYNSTTGKWGNANASGGGVADSVVGTVESGTTASQPYAVGEHFIRNDKFCTAIAAIASGATLTLNTNYVEGTIAEALIKQNTYSTDEIMIGTWFGQPLYRRCWEVQSLPNATEMTIQTGLTGLYVRFCYGCMHNISFCSNLPYVSKDNVANNVAIYTQFATSLNIIIKSGNNQSANSGVIVLEYTKNSENP